MTSHLIRVSTLKRGERITVLLNPAKYHLDLLERGEIKSFQIVERGKNFTFMLKSSTRFKISPRKRFVE